MKTVLIRILAVMVGFGVFFFVGRILQVPAVRIGALAAWGLGCMLFSYELGGARHVYRQGFEERNWLERAWLLAGAGCLIGAVALMVLYV